MPVEPTAFCIIAKPAGPRCNLDCRYCFYLPKQSLFPGGQSCRMSQEVLELFVRQYIASQPGPEIHFIWQGGEPTLLGTGFFRAAFGLQQKYCPPGKHISNSFQTNGTLLDDDWCALFKEHDVLVGVSLDGPEPLHDANRGDKAGQSCFAAVLKGLACLHKQAVRVNALACVSRANQDHGAEVYRFLRDECGLQHCQFIPVVAPAAEIPSPLVGEGGHERSECRVRGRPPPPHPAFASLTSALSHKGRGNALPNLDHLVTPWSVQPRGYGKFLCDVFDEWLEHDLGRIFVQQFETTLGLVMGMPPALCVYAPVCGRGAVVEHNGMVYACDHFVTPEHALGNLAERPLAELMNSARQRAFGQAKHALPRACRLCEFLPLCQGECPKNRLVSSPNSEPNQNYLCAGLKAYFTHTVPVFARIAQDLMRSQSTQPR